MQKNPRVAILILTMNQKEKTLRCLRSLDKIVYDNKKIFLFDNGSTDGTLEEAGKYFPEVITQYSPQNIGASSGRNSIAETASGLFNPELFLFLDNDTTVEKDFLDKLVEPHLKDNSFGITTSKIKCHGNPDLIYAAGGTDINFMLGVTKVRGAKEKDDGRFDKSNDCISSSGCMLVKVKAFNEVNGFDPVFNPYGFEDLDFSLRVLSKSYRSIYVPQSVIYHDPEPSRSSSGGKITSEYMNQKTKNWLIFLLRHAPITEKYIFLIFIAPVKLFWMFTKGIFKGNLKLPVAIINGFFTFRNVGKKI